jgi:Protein of unknown function TPD sequence-motif
MNDSNHDDSTMRQQPQKNQQELWWQVKDPPVPLASEEKILGALVRRGEKERGMICNQPQHRLRQIQRAVNESPGITLHQALSLRRHHIMLRHPGKRPAHLGLGPEQAIRESAEIFERVVEDMLTREGIHFLNETQQRANQDNQILLTPDFVFPETIELRLFRVPRRGGRTPLRGRTVHWLEAKMFYGASSIPHGTPGAVGTILQKMERYVEAFGPGAIVFMQGYGDQLANDLDAIGVTVLSGTAIPKHMIQRVWDHQLTWCANSDGRILP